MIKRTRIYRRDTDYDTIVFISRVLTFCCHVYKESSDESFKSFRYMLLLPIDPEWLMVNCNLETGDRAGLPGQQRVVNRS